MKINYTQQKKTYLLLVTGVRTGKYHREKNMVFVRDAALKLTNIQSHEY